MRIAAPDHPGHRRRAPAAARAAVAVAAALVAPAVVCPSSARGQSNRAERAEAFVRSFADLGRFNGVALVVDGREVILLQAFGLSDFTRNIGNEPTTRFRIASLTKQLTAALVLDLAEDGLVDLDAPIRTYIGEYPSPQGDRVTLHHLLDHTSGIPSYTDLAGFLDDRAETPLSPGEIVALTWEEPLSFEPGTGWSYSNTGYVLLGWIVERVTGQTYASALGERILAPLGLAETGYDRFASPPDGHAAGFTRTLARTTPARPIDPSLPFSAGMLYSTASDLYRWSRGLAGWDRDAFPLDPATVEKMLTPEFGYGYGIRVDERSIGRDQSVRTLGHTGGIFGFTSVMRVFPDHGRMIILLDNTSSDLDPIADGLTNLLWGLEAVPPKPSIAERLLPIVRSAGVAPAVERFRDWRVSRPDQYEYGPGELMRLAGVFRDEGDVATAVALLDAEAEAFAGGPMIRFALAELYAELGDTARAIPQLETALAGMPGEPRLIRALLDLGVEPPAALRTAVRPVRPEALMRLVGGYRIDPVTTLEIMLDGEVLLGRRADEDPFPLLPQSETTFLIEGTTTQLVFAVDGDRATAVSILEAGRRVTFPRIAPHSPAAAADRRRIE